MKGNAAYLKRRVRGFSSQTGIDEGVQIQIIGCVITLRPSKCRWPAMWPAADRVRSGSKTRSETGIQPDPDRPRSQRRGRTDDRGGLCDYVRVEEPLDAAGSSRWRPGRSAPLPASSWRLRPASARPPSRGSVRRRTANPRSGKSIRRDCRSSSQERALVAGPDGQGPAEVAAADRAAQVLNSPEVKVAREAAVQIVGRRVGQRHARQAVEVGEVRAAAGEIQVELAQVERFGHRPLGGHIGSGRRGSRQSEGMRHYCGRC